MDFKRAVCEALRVLRMHRKKSQEQVFLETGCSISNIENGRSCPSLQVFAKLCDYYRVDPGRFLTLVEVSLVKKIPIKTLVEKEWGGSGSKVS